MTRALVFSGSIRTGSFNARLAAAMADRLRTRGAEVTEITLADYPLPVFNEDLEAEHFPEEARRLAALFAAAGIVFISTPEYNGGVAPLTKNTVDWVSRNKGGPLRQAVWGLGAVSSGKLSGVVGLSHLRDTLSKIGAVVAPLDVRLGPADTAFTPEGEIAEDQQRKRADNLADMLVRLAGD